MLVNREKALDALQEIARAAWSLCDSTEEHGEVGKPQYSIPGDAYERLSDALGAAEALVPQEEGGGNAGVLVDLLRRESEPLSHALHRLWTAAVGTKPYAKQPWREVAYQIAFVEEKTERATLCSANGPGPALCCTLVVAHDGDHYDDVNEKGWGHRRDLPCASCDGRGCPACRNTLEDAMRVVREKYGIAGIYDDFQGPEDALQQMARFISEAGSLYRRIEPAFVPTLLSAHLDRLEESKSWKGKP